MDKVMRVTISGLALLCLAGCHPSTPKGTTAPGGASAPAASAGPRHDLAGEQAFVPYADKPPLGTPVETH